MNHEMDCVQRNGHSGKVTQVTMHGWWHWLATLQYSASSLQSLVKITKYAVVTCVLSYTLRILMVELFFASPDS